MTEYIKVRRDNNEALAADFELHVWRRHGWTPVDDEIDTAESDSADEAYEDEE